MYSNKIGTCQNFYPDPDLIAGIPVQETNTELERLLNDVKGIRSYFSGSNPFKDPNQEGELRVKFVEILIKISDIYRGMGNISLSDKYLSEAESVQSKINWRKDPYYPDINLQLAEAFLKRSNLDKGEMYCRKAEIRLNDPEYQEICKLDYNHIGMQKEAGYRAKIEVIRGEKNIILGNTQQAQRNFNKAIVYLKKKFDLHLFLRTMIGQSEATNNLTYLETIFGMKTEQVAELARKELSGSGSAMTLIEQLSKEDYNQFYARAVSYLGISDNRQMAEKYALKGIDKDLLIKAIVRLGNIYSYSCDNKNLDKFVYPLYKAALNVTDIMDKPYLRSEALLGLAEISYRKQEYSKAIEKYKLILKLLQNEPADLWLKKIVIQRLATIRKPH